MELNQEINIGSSMSAHNGFPGKYPRVYN